MLPLCRNLHVEQNTLGYPLTQLKPPPISEERFTFLIYYITAPAGIYKLTSDSVRGLMVDVAL